MPKNEKILTILVINSKSRLYLNIEIIFCYFIFFYLIPYHKFHHQIKIINFN